MVQNSLFGIGKKKRQTQVPPTVSRSEESSTSPREPRGRHIAPGNHKQAQRRPVKERSTNPVNHARADVALGHGHAQSIYGNHYGTLNPRDEVQAAYAARRRRSSHVRLTRIVLAILLAALLLWVVVTLIGSCTAGGVTQAQTTGSTVTLSGSINVG